MYYDGVELGTRLKFSSVVKLKGFQFFFQDLGKISNLFKLDKPLLNLVCRYI